VVKTEITSTRGRVWFSEYLTQPQGLHQSLVIGESGK
jgi:hypothetical protein